MRIGRFDLTQEVLLIAEIGNNHEGDFDRACDMVRAAAEAGAGAVKFQTIVPDQLVSVSDTKRIAQLTRFQFSPEQYRKLSALGEQNGIIFMSTPFDVNAVDFLDALVPAYKIASSDNDFYPLLEAVAQKGKPVIVSTGLADLDQIQRTKAFVEHIWATHGIDQQLAVLHCVTSYPTVPEDANLAAISTLQREVGGVVGYSDHTLGIEAAVGAVALGARIIEKHFTLDKNFSDFRDHQLSADPKDFKELVARIKDMQLMLGDGNLAPRACELAVTEAVRRSVVASIDLTPGTTVTSDMISWVRPGGGLAPGQEEQVLGKRIKNKISKGQKILVEDLET